MQYRNTACLSVKSTATTHHNFLSDSPYWCMQFQCMQHIQTISDQYFRCICFQASSILFHFICHTQLLIQSKLILSDLCAQLGKPHGNQHCCAQALNKVKILAYYIIDVVLSMLHDSHSFPILSRADSLALQASSQAQAIYR